MSVLIQILSGSAILVVCTLIHIGFEVWIVRRMRRSRHVGRSATAVESFVICSGVVFCLLISHTVQLYIWAVSIWLLGALPWYEEPIYFALVTYTTVGYGDVTLPPDFRIFGAMAGVNGVLAFGMTTAFLVSFFPRIIAEFRETEQHAAGKTEQNQPKAIKDGKP
ncbi:MAG: ion channel [Pseudomonadota bacterium]